MTLRPLWLSGMVLGVLLAAGHGRIDSAATPDTAREARAPEVMTMHLRRLERFLLTGEGDISSICRQLALELREQANDPSEDDALRLEIASIALDASARGAQELAERLLGLKDRGMGLSHRGRAIGALWAALIGLGQLEAAADVGKRAAQASPEDRAAMRMVLLPQMLSGRLMDAGAVLVQMLDAPSSKLYGFRYSYPMGSEIKARDILWQSPFSHAELPFVQEMEESGSTLEVAYDLPELEGWVKLMVQDPQACTALEQRSASATGWKYLWLRVALERALASGIPESHKALAALVEFMTAQKADASPLLVWLRFRVSMQAGDYAAAYTGLLAVRDGMYQSYEQRRDVTYHHWEAAASALGMMAVDFLSGMLSKGWSDETQRVVENLNDKDFTRHHLLSLALARLHAKQPLQGLAEDVEETLLRGEFGPGNFALLGAPAQAKAAAQRLRYAAWSASALFGGAFRLKGMGELRRAIEDRRKSVQQNGIRPHESSHFSWALPRSADHFSNIRSSAAALVAVATDGGLERLKELKGEVEEGIARVESSKGERPTALAPMIIELSAQWFELHALYAAAAPAVRDQIEIPKPGGILDPLPLESEWPALMASVTAEGGNLRELLEQRLAKLTAEPALSPQEAVESALVLALADRLLMADDERVRAVRAALEGTQEMGPAVLCYIERFLQASQGNPTGRSAMHILLVHDLGRAPIEESSYYWHADAERCFGYPERFSLVEGDDALRKLALFRQWVLRDAQRGGLHGLADGEALNARAWLSHVAHANIDAIPRLSRFALAVGVSIDPNAELPPPFADFERIAAILDTLAWGIFDNGDRATALATEDQALKLSPAAPLYLRARERLASK